MRNKIIAIIIVAGLTASCNSGKKVTTNASTDTNMNAGKNSPSSQLPADGKSFETAIVIQEKSETAGVQAEYQWIREHYSNYKVAGQSLSNHGKKPYDIITIELADNSKQDIYFDISKFFGHY